MLEDDREKKKGHICRQPSRRVNSSVFTIDEREKEVQKSAVSADIGVDQTYRSLSHRLSPYPMSLVH